MLEFNQAFAAIHKAVNESSVVEFELLELGDVCGRVLAENIVSSINVPPANNSAMDGFAINVQSIKKRPQKLPITQRIADGDKATALLNDSAARIFTGAEIPAGANCVVIQENCDQVDDYVIIKEGVLESGNIRSKGQDIRKEAIVLSKGHKIAPQDIGLLASIGADRVKVFKALRVAVLSTGNELVAPGHTLERGQIYDSNRFMLTAICSELNCEIIDTKHIGDDHADTLDALNTLREKTDLIVSCGGVSVGEEDHVKNAVLEIGSLDFWKINIKPGKPLALGKINTVTGSNCIFLGLPGNPVSAFVTMHLFGKVLINTLQGVENYLPRRQLEKANFATKGKNKRAEFVRVRQSKDGLELFANQSSGVLSSVCWADAISLIPKETAINPGDLVETYTI